MSTFCNCVHYTVTLQIVSKIFRLNDGYPVSTAITENVDFQECHTFKT